MPSLNYSYLAAGIILALYLSSLVVPRLWRAVSASWGADSAPIASGEPVCVQSLKILVTLENLWVEHNEPTDGIEALKIQAAKIKCGEQKPSVKEAK